MEKMKIDGNKVTITADDFTFESTVSYLINLTKQEIAKQSGKHVVKSDFTVLEYKHDCGNGKTYLLRNLECFSSSIKKDFKKDTITKVRRNSDGEVFSVGDLINIPHIDMKGRMWSIDCFSVEFDGVLIVGVDKLLTFNKGEHLAQLENRQTNFKNIKKAYEVEDGWVCEGDMVWMYFVDKWVNIPYDRNGEYGADKIYKNDPRKKEDNAVDFYIDSITEFMDGVKLDNGYFFKRIAKNYAFKKDGDKLQFHFYAFIDEKGSDIKLFLFDGDMDELMEAKQNNLLKSKKS